MSTFVAYICVGRQFRSIDFIAFIALGPVLWGCLFLMTAYYLVLRLDNAPHPLFSPESSPGRP